jgi:hypothetical protein
MGASLNRDKVIKLPFHKTLGEKYTSADLVFPLELLFSEAKDAPMYLGPDVKRCCKAQVDLTALSKKDMRKIRGVNGRIYYEVLYNLVLSTSSANLKYSLEFDGREMGSVEVDYV